MLNSLRPSFCFCHCLLPFCLGLDLSLQVIKKPMALHGAPQARLPPIVRPSLRLSNSKCDACQLLAPVSTSNRRVLNSSLLQHIQNNLADKGAERCFDVWHAVDTLWFQGVLLWIPDRNDWKLILRGFSSQIKSLQSLTVFTDDVSLSGAGGAERGVGQRSKILLSLGCDFWSKLEKQEETCVPSVTWWWEPMPVGTKIQHSF